MKGTRLFWAVVVMALAVLGNTARAGGFSVYAGLPYSGVAFGIGDLQAHVEYSPLGGSGPISLGADLALVEGRLADLPRALLIPCYLGQYLGSLGMLRGMNMNAKCALGFGASLMLPETWGAAGYGYVSTTFPFFGIGAFYQLRFGAAVTSRNGFIPHLNLAFGFRF